MSRQPQGAAEGLRGWHRLLAHTVGNRKEGVESEVNAGHGAKDRLGVRSLRLHRERDVPAVRFPPHRSGEDPPPELLRSLLGPQGSKPREPHRTPEDMDRARKAEGGIDPLALEAREAAMAARPPRPDALPRSSAQRGPLAARGAWVGGR